MLCRLLPQHAIDAGSANAEPSRNLGRTYLVPVAELANNRGIDLRLPALVHAARLRCGNAFSLPFLPQVGFELSEHAKHVKEGLARRGAGIDRLLRRAQGYLSLLQFMNNVLQIPQRPCEPVDARDDKGIAWPRRGPARRATCSGRDREAEKLPPVGGAGLRLDAGGHEAAIAVMMTITMTTITWAHAFYAVLAIALAANAVVAIAAISQIEEPERAR